MNSPWGINIIFVLRMNLLDPGWSMNRRIEIFKASYKVMLVSVDRQWPHFQVTCWRSPLGSQLEKQLEMCPWQFQTLCLKLLRSWLQSATKLIEITTNKFYRKFPAKGSWDVSDYSQRVKFSSVQVSINTRSKVEGSREISLVNVPIKLCVLTGVRPTGSERHSIPRCFLPIFFFHFSIQRKSINAGLSPVRVEHVREFKSSFFQ
jgi:hypothetical protein